MSSYHETSSLLKDKNDEVNVLKELQIFFNLAWPVVATFICEFLPGLLSVVFVGHLHGKEDLDATALATMYFNVFGMSLGVGMATAMDTLCSQANGAGNPRKIGVYLQRGLIVLTGVLAISFLLMWYAGELLILAGQDPVISRMSGDYCRILLPGLPMFFLYEIVKKCLQSQQVVLPPMFIAGVSIVLNLLFCFLFITVLGWGYLGAALARTLAAFGAAVLVVVYVMRDERLHIWWAGWDMAQAWDWDGLWEWVSLGVPGCLMVCLEWWAFELVAIMAGWLPDRVTALGANVILLNCTAMVFMLALGTGVATTVRIGNLLGEARPEAARSVAQLAVGLGAVLSLGLSGLIMLFRDQIPSLFSNNPEIEGAVRGVLWVLAAYQLPDVLNCVASSVLKGCGKQAVGAQVYVVTYYCVGLPLAYGLAFGAHLNLTGLWLGMTGGICTSASIMSILVIRIDWGAACLDACERVRRGSTGPAASGKDDSGQHSYEQLA